MKKGSPNLLTCKGNTPTALSNHVCLILAVNGQMPQNDSGMFVNKFVGGAQEGEEGYEGAFAHNVALVLRVHGEVAEGNDGALLDLEIDGAEEIDEGNKATVSHNLDLVLWVD